MSARKPVMSFAPDDEVTDAKVLAKATGESEEDVCPPHRRYELAMAPPMAAEALNREPFLVAELVDELELPDRGIGFVEGVGGPRSPLAFDGDSVLFVQLLDPDEIVLVGESKLGVINDVLACRDSLSREVLVYLNRFDASDDLAARNLRWLTDDEGLTVFTRVEDLACHLGRDSGATLTQRSQSVEAK